MYYKNKKIYFNKKIKKWVEMAKKYVHVNNLMFESFKEYFQI
jgi:hypothetical protein